MGERNRFAFDRDYYNRIAAEMINGSTVRKSEAAPSAEPVRREIPAERPAVRPAERPSGAPQIKTRYLIRFNVIKFALVFILVGCVVQFALNLLSVKSDVNCIDKEIASAKIVLEDVNSYNESLLGQLDISYDRNYIYNVAVGKLGMVYPKDNAVLYYKTADTSHVIQYRDIS